MSGKSLVGVLRIYPEPVQNLTFRLDAKQRRYGWLSFLIVEGVFLLVALVAGLGRHSWGVALIGLEVVAVAGVILALFTLIALTSWAKLTPDAIRSRRLGRERRCRWQDVSSIKVKTTSARGMTSSDVQVTLHSGKRFLLGGVTSSAGDRKFTDKAQQIIEYWQVAAEAVGSTLPEGSAA